MNPETINFFLTLENKLHQKEVRNSPEQVSALLADDFLEFGCSGRTYDKPITVSNLKDDQTDPKITIKDFKVNQLSAEIVLATYTASQPEFDSKRGSIWKLIKGQWQMVFHQGTKVK